MTLRAKGRIAATFSRDREGRTRIASLEEGGGYRLRLIRPRKSISAPEGAIINTGGGMAGGDRLKIDIDLGDGAQVLLSTPAAERIYGSTGPDASVEISLRLGASARLAWLPQETILYAGARLARCLTVDMEESATLVLSETVIFGRTAMGEVPGEGAFADRWRIRRGGKPLHAEETRLAGHVSKLLARPAIGGGAKAIAAAAVISPEAEEHIEAARRSLAAAGSECGVSAWKGMMLARLAARDPALLRADLVRFLHAMMRSAMRSGLPRLWATSRSVEEDAPARLAATEPSLSD